MACNISMNYDLNFYLINYFLYRVVYQWKPVVILEHASFILELNVYQVHAALVVNYFHQVIHVVHLEILVMYPNSAMVILLRYFEHNINRYYSIIFIQCPDDDTLLDGSSCHEKGGTCFHGMCVGAQQQCVDLWGPGEF
jgi:hypothetical protein